MNSSKKDANRTIQYSLTDFVPFCERQMMKFSGGVIFRSTAHIEAPGNSNSVHLSCAEVWGEGLWLGSLPGWSSIKFIVLCFLTQRPISGSFSTSDICFTVAFVSFSQNPQSIRSLGAGEGVVTAVVWGCTRDWGWYDRRLTCFLIHSLLFIFI